MMEETREESCHCNSGDNILTGMVAGVTTHFGPFCSKDFSSSVCSFLESLITHFSWILEVVKEVEIVLKVLVVLEAILEVIGEGLGIRYLSFLIWVFLYCVEDDVL